MGKYFGTDGFRAEANVELTADHALMIGRFLGFYYGKKHKCRAVIGKDTRRSSYMLEYAIVAGLVSVGADAYLLHVTTTPSVSYVVRTEDFDCGIMISASHNPFYDNGIKLINGQGEKMSDEVIADIEAYLDGSPTNLPLSYRENIGRTVDYVIGRNRYIGYIISLSGHSYRDIRVGLDCSNGSTWMLAKSIFDALGAHTYVIGNEPNGLNINEGCGSVHIEALRALVREEGLDIGFAFDGDADRCIAVDENGEALTGDHILYFCALYMKRLGRLPHDAVAATVMSNCGLFSALEKNGISCKITDVGDRYVYEEMRSGGLGLGGEESGHIIFSKYSTTGDGLITAIKIMEVMIESGVPASELCRGLYMFPRITRSFRVPDRDAVLNSRRVRSLLEQTENKLGRDGRVLLRKSGTEPLIRIMIEARDESLCAAASDEFSALITDFAQDAR